MLKLIQRTPRSNRTVALAKKFKYMFQLSPQVTKMDLKDWLETRYNVRVRSIHILKPYKKPRRSHRYQSSKIAIVALSPVIDDITQLRVHYQIDTLATQASPSMLSVFRGQPALSLTTSKPLKHTQLLVSASAWPSLRDAWTQASSEFVDQVTLPKFLSKQSDIKRIFQFVVDAIARFKLPFSEIMRLALMIEDKPPLPISIPESFAKNNHPTPTWREIFEASRSRIWPFPWRWGGTSRLYWEARLKNKVLMAEMAALSLKTKQKQLTDTEQEVPQADKQSSEVKNTITETGANRNGKAQAEKNKVDNQSIAEKRKAEAKAATEKRRVEFQKRKAESKNRRLNREAGIPIKKKKPQIKKKAVDITVVTAKLRTKAEKSKPKDKNTSSSNLSPIERLLNRRKKKKKTQKMHVSIFNKGFARKQPASQFRTRTRKQAQSNIYKVPVYVQDPSLRVLLDKWRSNYDNKFQ